MKKNKKQESIMAEGVDIAGADIGKKAKKKKRKIKKAPVIIAIVVVLFVAFRIAGSYLSSSVGTMVTTTKAVRGDLQESISTSGTVHSEEVKVVFAPVNGTLAEVNVQAGDAVKAGELLVSYDMGQQERTFQSASLQQERSAAGYNGALADNSESNAKLYEANVSLEILEQQLTDLKAYLKTLQNELSKNQRDRSRELAREDLELRQKLNNRDISEEEFNRINNQLAAIGYEQQMIGSSDRVVELEQEIANVQESIAACEEYKMKMESQKSTSEATVLDSYGRKQLDTDKEMAELNFQEAEEQYSSAQTGVIAEFDGIVTSCLAIPGEGVVQGTQLLTLESSRNLKVSFDASQYDLEKLKLGQKADVVILGNTYHGEISKINRMAERNMSDTPLVGVELHLLDGDDNIILGMDAKLTIYTQKSENALLIPVEVINADRDGDFLYCVEDGVIVRKPIVCGISTDLYTEVLEGITEDDVIVVSSFGDLVEGMAVTAMPEGDDGTSADGSGSGMSLTITTD